MKYRQLILNVKRQLVETTSVGIIVALALAFAPSLDKLSEAHAFMEAAGYLKGNGVLVGRVEGGTTRVWFLTSRHEILGAMLTTNKAFIDGAYPDYTICIRKKGCAFRYVRFANIDPERWMTVRDVKQDFAWLELTPAEMTRVVGGDGLPRYVDLDREVLREIDYSTAGFSVGSEIRMLTTAAPVIGDGEAWEKWYGPYRLACPGFDSIIAFPYYSELTLLSFREQIELSLTQCEGDGSVSRPVHILKGSVHVNNSGSPMFVDCRGADGRMTRRLVGLMAASSSNGFSAFQSIDSVLPGINGEPGGARAVKLVDYAFKGERR